MKGQVQPTVHQSVMPTEVLAQLRIKKGGWYVDATLGGGGHTRRIIALGARVIGLDRDEDALQRCASDLATEVAEGKLQMKRARFSQLSQVLDDLEITTVDGVLLDLGMSSDQLADQDRGFAFQTEGKLDMRMDSTDQVTAADLVNGLTESELVELLTKFGEMPMARSMVRAIISARQQSPIVTTHQLKEVLEKKTNWRNWKKKISPATLVFQALRIAVNDELNELNSVLPIVEKRLNTGGRLVVISFQSLEDRIVKEYLRKSSGLAQIGKIMNPTHVEIELNPRARSAKMRVAEKI